MKAYRIYFVSPEGRLQLGQAYQAVDDRAAGARAELLAVNRGAAELWEGGRMVGRVSDDGVFESGAR